VIPNAIELDRIMGSRVSRAEARRRLRLVDGQIGVAIIANLRREKRHDVFIEAARRLTPRMPKLRFLVIGDGPHRDAVHAAAAASGLSHDVLRLMGPRDDVPDLLAGIDICCLSSEQECFSVSMLEAAAAGVPFIGPDVGCIPEFLENRTTGLLTKPADARGLADAIAELAADGALRRKLAECARRKVISGYGIDSMARSFAELFFSVGRTAGAGWMPGGRRGSARPRRPKRTQEVVAHR
jgi:glycosyltransferase involved in cell wall biosynthesis